VATLDQLLSGRPIVCTCGLQLRVDEQRSEGALQDLRELRRRIDDARR
jgi:hypothetical protein